MFTGIIESLATVKEVISKGTNRSFWVESGISPELKVDQSVAHNGVCLTVEEIRGSMHKVTAIGETLDKTTLAAWNEGMWINLERSLSLGARLDGHLVQGHVDATATCTSIVEKNGSTEISFQFPSSFAELIIEKGSICVDGISLTAFNVKADHFTVAIIPYTYEHTNLQYLMEGGQVNLEFDLIGKYLLRRLSLKETN